MNDSSLSFRRLLQWKLIWTQEEIKKWWCQHKKKSFTYSLSLSPWNLNLPNVCLDSTILYVKPISDTYTQLQHHQRRTLWSNMKSDYVSLWYTQFRKLRASKGSDPLLCKDTEFDLHLVILQTLHWQLPFHSTLVTRRPYLGHDNWRQRSRFSPIIKYHWRFDTHEKD